MTDPLWQLPAVGHQTMNYWSARPALNKPFRSAWEILSLSVGASHTLYAGSGLPYGSMLTSVLKTSDICTFWPHSDILFLLIILGVRLLPGNHAEEEVAWLGVHLATPRPAQLSLLDLFFSLILYNLLVSVVILSCIIWDLLCICGGFLRGFCPHSNQGSGKEGAVHSTNCKAHWDDAKLLFLATYTKLFWLYLTRWVKRFTLVPVP